MFAKSINVRNIGTKCVYHGLIKLAGSHQMWVTIYAHYIFRTERKKNNNFRLRFQKFSLQDFPHPPI